jgi:hypothetical protein
LTLALRDCFIREIDPFLCRKMFHCRSPQPFLRPAPQQTGGEFFAS